MERYTERDRASNPVVSFTLHRQQPRTRGDLDAWVTRALASCKPWTWPLAARLARTWDHNPNHQSGAHAKERGAREAQLRDDLATHARLRGGHAATRLPGALGRRAAAVLHQVARLIEGGDWWKPWRRVDRTTGEVIETLYLPEDTWSAQTALAWCIERLDILVRAAGGMTEKATPRSKPSGTARGSGRRMEASRSGITEADLARLREKYG